VLQHSYDSGIQAGIEQGREEGREEGREDGRQEGREEGRMIAILQNARKMKELGIDDETIMRVTGLDKAKVNSL
jgi:predicted transposase YdaD